MMDAGVMKMLNEEREQVRQELEAWINMTLVLAQECWQWEMASRQFGELYYDKFADEWRKRRGLLDRKPGERVHPSWNDILKDYKAPTAWSSLMEQLSKDRDFMLEQLSKKDDK